MDHDPLAVRLVMALMLFVVAAFLLALAFWLHSPGPAEVRTSFVTPRSEPPAGYPRGSGPERS